MLPKVFARGNLDPTNLGGLIDLISNIAMDQVQERSGDVLGLVFEYFLGEFALAEGKKGGQFSTPNSDIKLLVAMLEPYKGRVFDPCCGSGSMFVQSEEFLLEVRGIENKNIALEALCKLLNDEIKTRMKTNLMQSKSLMEMLEQALKRYHNKAITSAPVIDELINLAKDIQDMDQQAEAIWLSEFEYAFYTAVANNESACQLMQQDKLHELAVVLSDRVRKNTSIDWAIKESIQARLRVIVKRTLRQYGSPPYMQKLATETVLKQAELIADVLVSV